MTEVWTPIEYIEQSHDDRLELPPCLVCDGPVYLGWLSPADQRKERSHGAVVRCLKCEKIQDRCFCTPIPSALVCSAFEEDIDRGYEAQFSLSICRICGNKIGYRRVIPCATGLKIIETKGQGRVIRICLKCVRSPNGCSCQPTPRHEKYLKLRRELMDHSLDSLGKTEAKKDGSD